MYLCGTLDLLVEFCALFFCIWHPEKQKTNPYYLQKDRSCGPWYEILETGNVVFSKFQIFLQTFFYSYP
jgi:hypothetical protein